MMNILRLMIFFNLFTVQISFAQEFRRQVNLEWETIEGATAYDVEVSSLKNSKAFSFKVKSTEWQGRLTPGLYNMRLRARDYRSVPGDWSALIPFTVGLDPVNLQKPAANEVVNSPDDTTEKITFQWASTQGANHYVFEVSGDGSQFTDKQELKTTSVTVELPVAQKYQWSVTAVFNNDIQSEKQESKSFTIFGRKLNSPKIDRPENEFVRKISWQKSDYVENFNLALHRYDEKTKKWTMFKSFENATSNELAFDSAWEGGQYRLIVKAKNPNRIVSEPSVIKFKVRDGDRTPAAEYVATVRKSIDRVSNWFAIASYMISDVEYRNSIGISFNGALTGTGRVGFGYLSEKSPWGMLAIADYSGIKFDKGTQNYSSVELSALYKLSPGDRSEVRYSFGLYNKEYPFLIYQDFGRGYSASKVAVLGPQAGIEYWYSLNPKFGFQLNSHIYYSAVDLGAPDRTEFKPSISYHIGVLGSYRMTPRWTGLLGLTRRTDNLDFKYRTTGQVGQASSDADVTTSMTGYYLSLFTEYDF